MTYPPKDQGNHGAKQQHARAKELTLMYWLELQRNSKAKFHRSWCWHMEKAFPLASSLLSICFAEAAQAERSLVCPWLLASTCMLSLGLEVTGHKRLAKATPSITNIFFTLNFHSHKSCGLTCQCVCLLVPPLASGLHLQHGPCSCIWQLYQPVYFALLAAFFQPWLRQWMLVGDMYQSHLSPLQNLQSFLCIFICNFLYSRLTSNFPSWGLIPCALSVLQSSLGQCYFESKNWTDIGFYFVLFSCRNGNPCYCHGLDHLHEHIIPMEATQLPSKEIWEAVF